MRQLLAPSARRTTSPCVCIEARNSTRRYHEGNQPMQRLLLLMTSTTYRAHAFLEAAKRLDIPVTVGSERSQALAAANPAGHLTLDFAAPEEATRTIVEFAKAYPIGGVVAADDDGVILAAMASSALGLPHNPVAAVAAARDKYRMRQILSESGIPCPRFWR